MNDNKEESIKNFTWIANFNTKDENCKRVCGYIFNENGEILIVKTENKWHFPCCEITADDNFTTKLEEVVMKQACVTIKNITYLGSVKIEENEDTYYNVKYTAKLDAVESYVKEDETNERKLVSFKELDKYLTICNTELLFTQLNLAKQMLNIE